MLRERESRSASRREPASVRPWLVTVPVNEARGSAQEAGRRPEAEHLGEVPDQYAAAAPAMGVAMIDLITALEPAGA